VSQGLAGARRTRLVKTLCREAALIGLFASIALFATRPLAFGPRTTTLAGFDPPIYVWTVDWLVSHLSAPSELLEGTMFYPARHAVLCSDLALGSALLVAPFQPFVRDPLPLFNLSVILTLVFGAWAFSVLGRRLTGSLGAGILTGILAAFGPHQLLHVSQLGLINNGWLALFLLGLHRTLARPSLGSVMLTGGSFALTGLSCAYFVVAAAILSLVFAILHAGQLRSRAVAASYLAAVLLALALMFPYMRAFWWLHSMEEVRRPLSESVTQAFLPSRDLTSSAYVYQALLGDEGQRLFPGIAVLALAALAVVRRRASVAFPLCGAALLLLLSLGPSVTIHGRAIDLPYRALFAIPPLDVMMHPHTFAGVALSLLYVLAGVGFASLRLERIAPPLLAVVLGLAEVAGPEPRMRFVPAGVPPVYSLLEGLPEGPILEVPLEAREVLIWAARHRRPIINGSGGVAPSIHSELEQWIRRHWVRAARESPASVDIDRSLPMTLIRRLPVRYLIVPAGRKPELRPLKAACDRARTLTRLAIASDGDALYEVNRGADPGS
jgi:hypothetical protein